MTSNIKASYGVLIDQEGETLVCSVHPFLQLSVFLLIIMFFVIGILIGKDHDKKKGGAK